jgi:hypothetical protein
MIKKYKKVDLFSVYQRNRVVYTLTDSVKKL